VSRGPLLEQPSTVLYYVSSGKLSKFKLLLNYKERNSYLFLEIIQNTVCDIGAAFKDQEMNPE